MADYAKTTNFTAKDALSTGDPLKLIKGTYFDTEFDAIAVAVATKFDANDLASQGQAEAETSTAVAVTPAGLAYWSDYNAGIVGELQALADPNADGLLGWDDGAGAGANVIFFTAGTGLAFSTTTIALSHLGIEALVDPNADSFLMWDDSASATAFAALASESGLAFSATPDLKIDISSLSSSLTSATIAGADLFLIDDGAGGTNKKLAYQDFGIPTTTDTTTTPLSAADLTYANRLFLCTNAGAISAVIPANASIAYPVGTVLGFYQGGAGAVTVTVTTDTLRDPFSGAATTAQYSTVWVLKVAATEWAMI